MIVSSKAPSYIFYPALIIWSALYGMLGGAFFKLLAVYESWTATNRYHVLLWKKYPQRSYQKYISSIWTTQIRGRPVELAEFTKLRIERAHPTEPFPILRLMANTLFMLLLAPFMMCIGMIKGPVYVYSKARALRQRSESLVSEAAPESAHSS